jgi:hypothetical protein
MNQKTKTMKKLIILALALSISGIAKSQFSDLAFDSTFLSAKSENGFPNHLISEKKSFDSLRNEIHVSGVKYRYIEFDSLENPVENHVFDIDGFGIPRISLSEMREEQFSLVDSRGRIIKMIYLDPKI